MGVCVIGFYSEPIEIFHHVNFQTEIVGRAIVVRREIRILPARVETVFNRVFYSLVEHSRHNLLRRTREKFITQVDVVGHGMFQIRITALLVVLVDDIVRHNLEEARAVDCPVIRGMHFGIVVYLDFQMRARKGIKIVLPAMVARAFSGMQQIVALARMLQTYSRCEFRYPSGIFCRSVAGGYTLVSVVVKRVGKISETVHIPFNLVERVPVAPAHLRAVVVGHSEKIFVIEACAFFITVHSSGHKVDSAVCPSKVEAVRQIGVSGKVAVVVMLPAARSARAGCGLQAVACGCELYLRIVGSLIVSF